MDQENIYIEISKLIALKLNGDLESHAEKQLNDWLEESEENRQIYSRIISEGWYQSNLAEYEKFEIEEGWDRVRSKVKTKNKLIPLWSNVWKYAAAAIIVLGLGFVFKDRLFNASIDQDVIPVIVDTKPIEPGTDKATLTLEDGSKVALEKGNTFKANNVNSNGEKIVYEASKQKKKAPVYNYLTVPRGGQFFIELSDGTQVWLNSESELKYPKAFVEGETREVELVYGEAYFDVSPSTKHNGAKFRVVNRSQEIEVLGTEFNVKAYKDETNIYTTLVEGKVVVDNGTSKQSLTPSEQYNLNIETNSFTVAKVNVKKEVSWKEGIFSFIDMPLKDIMKVISRWYDVDVVFENKNLESVEFVGVLDKKQSIEDILSIIKSTSINDYVIDNKTLILK
ncbi:FecR family protein [Aestuariivivens insulae]|uniref:FecR family protein n=1 Tax=Aestuariivivens insulae TaxID=1621988 RepID=UPI001F5A4967|nr:FecR family protein [Aestuariivivens insulae]